MRHEMADISYKLPQKFILGLFRPEFLKTIIGSSEKSAYLDIYGFSPKNTHFLAKKYSSKHPQFSQKILLNSPKDTHVFSSQKSNYSHKNTLLFNSVEYEGLHKKVNLQKPF